jgi:dGTPase
MTTLPATDLAREHEDPLAVGRPPILLDRQRVIHASAFRRLQYKTQVFLSLEGDHFRTRLTHTLEVAEVARSLAAALDLNVDLAETVALAHDLGHPPFGHAGERALAACMQTHGGFEHNAQSLHVVEYLEHPYPEFRGLNLTHIVRECLAKHSTQFDKPGRHPLQDGRRAPLEGQAADLADRLAYALHDLQDGLYAGLIEPAALASLELWSRVRDGPPLPRADWRGRLRPAIDRMQSLLLEDAEAESRRRMAAHAGKARAGEEARAGKARDPRGAPAALVALSGPMDAALRALEEFLLDQVYRHHQLVRMDAKAARILREIFEAYVAEPRLMPRRFSMRVKEQGVQRVAADYLAGMTDRYCLTEHARLFDPRETA